MAARGLDLSGLAPRRPDARAPLRERSSRVRFLKQSTRAFSFSGLGLDQAFSDIRGEGEKTPGKRPILVSGQSEWRDWGQTDWGHTGSQSPERNGKPLDAGATVTSPTAEAPDWVKEEWGATGTPLLPTPPLRDLPFATDAARQASVAPNKLRGPKPPSDVTVAALKKQNTELIRELDRVRDQLVGGLPTTLKALSKHIRATEKTAQQRRSRIIFLEAEVEALKRALRASKKKNQEDAKLAKERRMSQAAAREEADVVRKTLRDEYDVEEALKDVQKTLEEIDANEAARYDPKVRHLFVKDGQQQQQPTPAPPTPRDERRRIRFTDKVVVNGRRG